jgi:hypothetical protein
MSLWVKLFTVTSAALIATPAAFTVPELLTVPESNSNPLSAVAVTDASVATLMVMPVSRPVPKRTCDSHESRAVQRQDLTPSRRRSARERRNEIATN